jgi:hypothetical protein
MTRPPVPRAASGGSAHETRQAIELEFDGLRLRAESGFPEDLQWLREFLCPQFRSVDDGTPAACVVRLLRDPDRFAVLDGQREAARERMIDCFALDQQVIRLPQWEGADGTWFVYDAKFHAIYVIDRASARVEIVAATRRRSPRVPAMRVLREFAMNHVLAQGHLVIHGSAFAIGTEGTVIAGPTRSGKTTLLMHLLSLGEATYVANDRVLVREGRNGFSLRGMPAITTLRSTTLDMYPALREELVRRPWSHRLTMAESVAAGQPIRMWEDARYGLTPAQFCTLLGVEARGDARFARLLLPRQTHRPGGITLRRLAPDESLPRLEEAIFGVGCWAHERNVFALPGEEEVPAADELRARSRRLAERLPVLECLLGEQAYADPAATRRLLANLPA